MSEKIKLKSGDLEYVFPGNFVKLVNGRIVEVESVLINNEILDSAGSRWEGSNIVAVASDKEDLDKSIGLPIHDTADKSTSVNIYDYLGNLVEVLSKEGGSFDNAGAEESAKKAVKYIFDFLAGRNTVNNKACLQEAIRYLIQADTKVQSGADDRIYKY